MQYKILKQFIPCGQPGDPYWSHRNVYVQKITSGSYLGEDETYADLQLAYLAQDALSDYAYNGHGEEGDGRIFLVAEIKENGKVETLTKKKIDKQKDISKTKKLTPAFHSFSPPSGSIGDTILISGSNFYGCHKVEFNKVPAEGKLFDTPTDNIITALVPASASTGKIEIFNYDGKSVKSDDEFVIVNSLSVDVNSLDVNSLDVNSLDVDVNSLDVNSLDVDVNRLDVNSLDVNSFDNVEK